MIRKIFQKIKRGYSDEDLYDAGYFICNMIPNVIESFIKEDKFGYPSKYSEMIEKMYPGISDKQKARLAEQEWNKTLSIISKCFREYLNEEPSEEFQEYWNRLEKLCGDDLDKLLNFKDEEDEELMELREKYEKKENELKKYRMEQLHEGFKLLEENIEEMWD